MGRSILKKIFKEKSNIINIMPTERKNCISCRKNMGEKQEKNYLDYRNKEWQIARNHVCEDACICVLSSHLLRCPKIGQAAFENVSQVSVSHADCSDRDFFMNYCRLLRCLGSIMGGCSGPKIHLGPINSNWRRTLECLREVWTLKKFRPRTH